MEVKSKIHQLFPISKAKAQRNTTEVPSEYKATASLDKKGDNGQRYSYYHSGFPPKYTPVLPYQPDKKQYKFVTEHLEDIRRKSQSQVVPNAQQNGSVREVRGAESQVLQGKTFSPFKKIERAAESQTGTLQFSRNDRYLKKMSTPLLHKKQSIEKHIPRMESTQMIESTILMQGSQVLEKQPTQQSSIFNGKQNVRMCESTVERLTSSDTNQGISDPVKMREKMVQLEKQCKVLEKRNFQLAQEMVSSESALKNYERRQGQMEENVRKHEESIKISRNIITSLNQKIARILKENQNSLKILRQNYEEKISTLQQTKIEEVKKAEGMVFELKLKIIDLNHDLQKNIAKKEKQIKEKSEKEIEAIKLSSSEKISVLEENKLKLNNVLVNMETDLVKIDGQNIRLDQENRKLLEVVEELQRKVCQKQGIEELMEDKDAKIAALNVSLTNSQLQILTQKEKIKNLQESEKEKVSQIGQHEKQIALLHENMKKSTVSSDEVEKYQKRIIDISSEMDSLRSEDKQKQTKIDNLMVQMQNMRLNTQKLQGADRDKSSRIKEYQEQILNLKKNILDLQENMKQLSNKQLSEKKELAQKESQTQYKCQQCLTLTQLIKTRQTELQEQKKQLQNYLDQQIYIQDVEKYNNLLKEELQESKIDNQRLIKQIGQKQLIYLDDKSHKQYEIQELKVRLQQLENQKGEVQEYIEDIRKLYRQHNQAEKQANQNPSDQTQNNDLEPQFSSPVKSSVEECEPSIGNQTPNSNFVCSMDEWLQNINSHQRQELVLKIHELFFMNKSLSMKVEDINSLQQNQSDMIMQKLRVFEESIEKYEQDIGELEEQNRKQQMHINQLVEQCRMLEGKGEWMDGLYRELEVNLFQSNQELMRVQVQFVNYRFQHLSKGAEGEEEESLQEIGKMIEEVQKEEESKVDQQAQEEIQQNGKNEEVEEEEPAYEVRVYQVDSEDSQVEQVDLTQKLKNQPADDEQGLITELDVINANSPPSHRIKSEEEESIQEVRCGKMMTEEVSPMSQEDLDQILCQQMLMNQEYHYQVEDTAKEVADYAIFVSHVDSDEEYQYQVEDTAQQVATYAIFVAHVDSDEEKEQFESCHKIEEFQDIELEQIQKMEEKSPVASSKSSGQKQAKSPEQTKQKDQEEGSSGEMEAEGPGCPQFSE